jgi:ATP-dependent exoDNAse (exonuclease V) beta subunit
VTRLADDAARLRTLTDLGSTLLVEAAAGTGKTALIAGRLTMLLAQGVEPSVIAAITFTDLAASALSARVHAYVGELLSGAVPNPLRLALPDGLDASQRRALSLAAAKLDELTTSTIHAFCQTIISSYAVEADIDPGARLLDALQADAAFDSVFDQWIKRRLDGSERADDPVATLSRDDPRHVVDTLRGLARLRLRHRGARVPSAAPIGRPDRDLFDAVGEFQCWLSGEPEEAKTAQFVGELKMLANLYAGCFDSPDFAALWRLAHPRRLRCMRLNSLDLSMPSWRSAWERVAGRERGSRLSEQATAYFERVDACYRTLRGRIASALVARISAEIDEALEEYTAFKRAAAVLDFDDLLEKARALVREHDDVRRALGERYRHIFVDEFQDTDPIQTEVLFRIAAEDRGKHWQDGMLRAGALFAVGDPKQAIYRFRGADIGSYARARAAIRRQSPDNIVQITANFRSRPDILAHINRCFAQPLSVDGQPGYVSLAPTLGGPEHQLPSAARLTVDIPPESRPAEIRDAEAEAVADLCARLIGRLRVRNENGAIVPLTAGGIALLAPTGAELWRYERALEQRGLPIASQAGKGLFRRQEVQDLLALARALADPRDTLAFGALMRGPLVGLTEEELLDITMALPPSRDRPNVPPVFSIRSDVNGVAHPHAHRTLAILQELRRRTRVTTPALLLAEAAERLMIQPVLAARTRNRNARAAANIEAFLERARHYSVRGLKQFVRDLTREWRDGVPHSEGRVDAEGDAIELITIHSAKGLEWPVVIPINTGTYLRRRDEFVYRPADETLHWLIGDVVPPDMTAAIESEEQGLARERERLWYVACTRARELLIVPELPQAGRRTWARIIDLAHRDLPELDLLHLTAAAPPTDIEPPNTQTLEVFATERAAIAAVSTPLRWWQPSQRDMDRLPTGEGIAIERGDSPETELPVGAGRVRGLLLHKLIEEVLIGELTEDVSTFAVRARELMSELVIDATNDAQLPDPHEIAATASRTLALPDVAALKTSLIPEWPIYAVVSESENAALAGRIDAIAFQDGQPFVVLDWKSDISPTEEDVRDHAGQLGDYMRATGAPHGALVYMTLGLVQWITSRPP